MTIDFTGVTELVFARTCQECGSRQLDKEPKDKSGPTDAYLHRKCKRCKSEALDYGSNGFVVKAGKIVDAPPMSEDELPS